MRHPCDRFVNFTRHFCRGQPLFQSATMNTSNNDSTLHLPGATSWSFHITQWILISFGILGNLLVIVWRCTGQKRRDFHLHSLLVVSLAFSDLLYCIQVLLREAILARPIFRDAGTRVFPYTKLNSRLCQTATFLTYSSSNAISVTSLSIAVHAFFLLSNSHHVKIVVLSVVAAGWFLSLTLAALAVYFLKKTEYVFHSLEPSVESLSLIIVFGCNGILYGKVIPVIVTAVNAVSSITSCFLYTSLCFKIRRLKNLSCRDGMQIRLIIIVVLHLVSWWPSCILYCYSYFTGASVMNGRLDPRIPEPAVLLVSAVSAANPIIYTTSLDVVLLVVKRLFACFGNSEDSSFKGLAEPLVSRRRRNRMLCCKFCWSKRSEEEWTYKDDMELSENTVETTAFDSA